MPSRTLLFALCAFLVSVPPQRWCALAEEDVQVDDDAGDAAAEAADAEAEAGGEGGKANFEDSAVELQEKLAQLNALLEAKGDKDPELAQRLAGLQNQLSALGLGDLMNGGAGGAGGIPSSKELTEFLMGCVVMSIRRAGMQRPTTLGSLRRMAEEKMTRDEAAQNDVWRMAGVCINELTEQELKQFKDGKLTSLPKKWVDASKKPEVEKMVQDIDDAIWKELAGISAALVQELFGNVEQAKPPNLMGLLAGVPVLGAVAFLAKKFMDMQNEKDNKKDKKKNSGKKSK